MCGTKQRQHVRDGVFLTLEKAISAKIAKNSVTFPNKEIPYIHLRTYQLYIVTL